MMWTGGFMMWTYSTFWMGYYINLMTLPWIKQHEK